MKQIFVFLLLLTICLKAFGQTNFNELVWSDEFNESGSPNPSYWTYDLGQTGWGNNEVQNYTKNTQNVRVENGLLVINAIKNNGSWTSARVKSQGLKSFTYGRIVWRAKLPKGSGTWPALWLLGERVNAVGWPACGEIDVMEHVGKNPGVVQCALHTPSSYGNTVNIGYTNVATFDTEFHTYELNWTTNKLELLVDGVKFYTYAPATLNSSTWPFNEPFFLIMNIAMGGNLGSDPQYETNGLKNGIDPSLSEVKMEIDYVRVYQTFTGLKLNGNKIIEKNQTGLTYSTNNVENATYEWIVPDGSVIVSGQGTSQVSVNWGGSEGDVKVKVTIDGVSYEKSQSVVFPVNPQGATFHLNSPEFGIEFIDRDPVNLFSVNALNNIYEIKYNVIDPDVSLGMEGLLYRPLNMVNYPVLKLKVKSANLSKSLNARIDLMDDKENATTKTPVFNLFPLIDDGEYFTYSFDFKNTNGWKSENGSVDASRITKMLLYIDFGIFGTVAEDSLWIGDIWIEGEGSLENLNRPSHVRALINGTVLSVSWQDNSTNEDGFEVFKANNKDGPYEKVATVSSNIDEANFTVDSDLTRYYYRVRSFNAANGYSDFSNTAQAEVVTSTPEVDYGHVEVYPNPANHVINVKINSVEPLDIKIITQWGRVILPVLSQSGSIVQFSVSELPQGIYLLVIKLDSGIIYKRIIRN